MQLRLFLYHYPAGWGQRAHVDGIDGLSLVVSGRVWERSQHAEVMAAPGQMVVKPSGVVHETRFARDTILLRVERQELFDPCGPATQWRWSTSRGAAARFLVALTRLESGRPEAALDGLRDAAVGEEEAPAHRSGPPPAWLRRAYEELADGAHAGVTVAEVAGRVGVHPVYLARAFRVAYGMTPSEALQRHRLGRAMGAVILNREPLAGAAALGGLTDQSHLTRSCRALLGLTPGQAAAQAGTGFVKVPSVQSPRARQLYPPQITSLQ